jgi:antibiotic biosynthesis monooxygenase (ABM) superfamily enzyme
MKQPPKWKFAVMVWIAIYPTITFVSYLIGDVIKEWPLPLKNTTHDGYFGTNNGFCFITYFKKITY